MNAHLSNWRYLATVLVQEACQDTLDERTCAEAWRFFRSPIGQACFALGYLDEEYALQDLPRPRSLAPISRGPKGKSIMATYGKVRRVFVSFKSASQVTGDHVRTIKRSIESDRPSQSGWTYRRVR